MLLQHIRGSALSAIVFAHLPAMAPKPKAKGLELKADYVWVGPFRVAADTLPSSDHNDEGISHGLETPADKTKKTKKEAVVEKRAPAEASSAAAVKKGKGKGKGKGVKAVLQSPPGTTSKCSPSKPVLKKPAAARVAMKKPSASFAIAESADLGDNMRLGGASDGVVVPVDSDSVELVEDGAMAVSLSGGDAGSGAAVPEPDSMKKEYGCSKCRHRRKGCPSACQVWAKKGLKGYHLDDDGSVWRWVEVRAEQ